MSSHSIKALDLLCMCVCVTQEPPRILKFNYQKGTTRAEAFLPLFFLSLCEMSQTNSNVWRGSSLLSVLQEMGVR